MNLLARWFIAFAFTQAVEIPIYRRVLHRGFWGCFGASAITHPLVWLFLCSGVWRAPWSAQVAVAEAFAWLAEAAYFRVAFASRGALAWTLVANGASFAFGLLCQFA